MSITNKTLNDKLDKIIKLLENPTISESPTEVKKPNDFTGATMSSTSAAAVPAGAARSSRSAVL